MSYFNLEAYDLFRRGHDTLDIARLTGRQEAEVLREINQVRSALRGKPYPYSPHADPSDRAIRKSDLRRLA